MMPFILSICAIAMLGFIAWILIRATRRNK